ncbi:MAG: type IV toxin-antitoxin system AbiEi family antitoxin domain-containing protein [Alphaproteobacteria bacterium]|nr:type IV toxin-antitoxin system AbiEi family antitoxin domain-containing protein [Alphaproteobacteria bacterium]
MANSSPTQRDRAKQILREQGTVRLRDLVSAGITATTVSRMEKAGELIRLGRGLYQLPDAPASAHHDLAIVAKAVPTGVVCLVSALAFHELTDVIPSRVWIAIGPKDRKPSLTYPALQIVRFSLAHMKSGIERHVIDGVDVSITTPARTIVDLFRYRQSQGRRFKSSPGLGVALEGLREALRKRKATPAEIARCAAEMGEWIDMRPYLEAMTANA